MKCDEEKTENVDFTEVRGVEGVKEDHRYRGLGNVAVAHIWAMPEKFLTG